MTTQRDAIRNAIEPTVNAGELAGAAALIWKADTATTSCVGWRDVDARLPVERDTLFRIGSMSKPITSVAALMLLEDGRLALDDPIARWAPEFSAMRVLRSPTSALDDTVPAEKPITIDDLLTHRSGLTYGAFHPGPLEHAFDEALGGDIDSGVTPDDWIAALATLPLIDHPGAAFHYGHSTDLLGLLIARIENAPLGEVLERRIFRPLGMTDTAFIVPRDKRHRRSKMYGFNDAEALVERSALKAFVEERPDDMAFASGGQGLWSTLDDYLRFARMFVGGGVVDGVRVLGEDTLRLMTTNRLTDVQRTNARLLGLPLFGAHGFGLGVAVVLDPERAAPTRCRGNVGTVGWPGAYGGWWQADPIDRSVLVFLAHNSFELDQFAKAIGLGVYSAITRFHAVATSGVGVS